LKDAEDIGLISS